MTFWFSSSRMVTLPCPSTRVTGSMTIRLATLIAIPFLSSCHPCSVVLDQVVGERHGFAAQEGDQGLPDGLCRRGTAWQVVVHLDHLVTRIDLVEQQRQLGIRRDLATRIV